MGIVELFERGQVRSWVASPAESQLWTRIFHVRPHSIGETRFFIIFEKLIFEKKLESPLILFLFLKGK